MTRKRFEHIAGFVLLAAAFGVGIASAQESNSPPQNFVEDVSNAGTSAAAFLQIGVGARAQSMGNAAATLHEDATSLFWNPASIALLEGDVNVAFDHTNWLVDTALDFVGLTFRIPGLGTLGLGVMSFQAVNEQPVRTILQPEGTGEFYSASDLALGVTYAASLTERFAAGVTGKYIRERLWNESASAGAFDLGVRYLTRLPGLSIGASIANFGSDMQLSGRDLKRPFDDDPANFSNDQLNVDLSTDRFSVPLTFRFGLGYERVVSDLHRFTLVADVSNPADNTQSMNLGAEYTFWNTVSLRGGFNALFEDDRTGGATFGMGVNRRLPGEIGLSGAYSYADWGILKGTHRLTLTVSR